MDDIIFQDRPVEKYLKIMEKEPLFNIKGWESVLPEPPKNSSRKTKREIIELHNLTKNLTQEQKDLVFLVDEEPNDLFKEYLEKHDLEFPEKMFRKIWNEVVDPIVLKLKWTYKRPRPFQLAGHFDTSINVINTSTHQTPAYPSGHAAYAHLAAYNLAHFYPEHKEEFFKIAGNSGFARMLQGVHYRSDNEASKILVDFIWESLEGRFNFERKTMPLKRCSDNNNNGWKWGDQGKCYTGPDGKKKAIKQGIVIEGPKKFREKASMIEESFSEEEVKAAAEAMHQEGYSMMESASLLSYMRQNSKK